MIDVHKEATGYVAKLNFETGDELLKEIHVLGRAIGEATESYPAQIEISLSFFAGLASASNKQEEKKGEANGRKNYVA